MNLIKQGMHEEIVNSDRESEGEADRNAFESLFDNDLDKTIRNLESELRPI